METLKLTCKNCGKLFDKIKYEYDSSIKGGQISFFCNLSCAISYNRIQSGIQNKIKYEKNPKKCKCCLSTIQFEDRHIKKIYCSKKCSYEDNKDLIKKNATKHGRFSLKKCKICENFTKHKYCSKKCESENDKQIRIQKLIDGKYSSMPYSGRSTLRRSLMDIKGKKCESCNLSEWSIKLDFNDIPIKKELPLTVHHIDGNAGNNKLENLKLLCWNCHSLTDNYGRKNKDSARRYRYKNGGA